LKMGKRTKFKGVVRLKNEPKKYLVADILVEAVLSEGGGFYELTVVATGQKQRYLSDVFESVAKPVYSKTEIKS